MMNLDSNCTKIDQKYLTSHRHCNLSILGNLSCLQYLNQNYLINYRRCKLSAN